MKEKKQSRRTKKKGTIWMTGGLLLLAAALFLTAYNLYDGKRAGLATDKVVASLVSEMEENQRQRSGYGGSYDTPGTAGTLNEIIQEGRKT